MKFMQCESCGNVVEFIDDKGIEIYCCGSEMSEIVPNSTDADKQKHTPVVERENNRVMVKVGENLHPMTDSHLIEWVVLETEKGSQKRNLKPTDENYVEFNIDEDDKVLAVYAFCNLHGLWKV